MGPTIDLLILNVLTLILLYPDNCNCAANLNNLTILAALEALQYVFLNNTLHFEKNDHIFSWELGRKKKPTMGNLVVVGV